MGDDNFFGSALYFKKKLKWYQKIWYFITGKKNKWQLLKFNKLGD